MQDFLRDKVDQSDCYVDAELLVKILEDEDLKRQTLIIDVREEDGDYACIDGAMHLPFPLVTKMLPEIFDDIKGYKLIVVHCEMSQIRGPKSANRIREFLADKRLFLWPRVMVLRGGFSEFADKASQFCIAPSVWK